MQPKVAIVGAGLMGQWHCHFAKSLGADIDTVVDLDPSRAAALAERFGCGNVLGSCEQLLERKEISIVHICTPTFSHAPVIASCLESGKHVLVEKPLAENLSVTSELLNCAHKRQLLLNPVHQFPFQRGCIELLARQSSLGAPVRIDYTTCSAGGESKSPAQRREVMLEILPHPVSLLFRLLPDAFGPDSFRVLRFTDDDLELSAQIGDVAISVTISLRGRPTRNELTYIGEAGSAYLDLFHGYAVFEGGEVSRSAKILKPLKFGAGLFLKAGTNLALRAAASEPAYPGLRELTNRFYEAVARDSAAPISVEEILGAAQLCDEVRVRFFD